MDSRILCFKRGCLMRTRDQNKEYMQKHRFSKKLDIVKRGLIKCSWCESPAQTLHHINENHADNHSSNLLPLCHNCHLEAKHKIEVRFCDTPKNARNGLQGRVTAPERPSLLGTTVTHHFTGETIMTKKGSALELHLDVSNRVMGILEEMGYARNN